ncbi:MAG: P1 family peptidase [Candidatus Bathyarchaeota archaeon]|nr:P1 family peptidase [Candidatus Bathyarchaeota archaeon]
MMKRLRARELGIAVGEMRTGKYNAITDVEGVGVGHSTIVKGDGPLVPGEGPIRVGVTAIVPHQGNVHQNKVRAASYIFNAYGKSIGLNQLMQMGVIETPILLTDTFNVWKAADAMLDYSFEEMGIKVPSINPVVGETNGGFLNDSYGRHVSKENVYKALNIARSATGLQAVEEGNVGGGTPMSGYGFKGGIGTSSRETSDFTLGVLVQLNLGRREDLVIDGVPVGRELADIRSGDCDGSGSIMVIIATDLDLTSRQLWKVAKRAVLGIARTGSYGSHGSGDFMIAFSTGKSEVRRVDSAPKLEEGYLNPVYRSVVEATEESIINALFKAETMVGRDYNTRQAIPLRRVKETMVRYGRIK